MEEIKGKPLPELRRNIKVNIRTWNALKSMKKENETFDDVIKDLLGERTQSVGDENIKAIKYHRKTSFFTMAYCEEIGFEFEYNDVKNHRADFVLDVKIKKVFFRRKVLMPSEFFGTDSPHKHFSKFFMEAYFNAVKEVFKKEFRIICPTNPYDLTLWRQVYYDYSLSEDSFKDDIEEPLRLSEEEKPSKLWKDKVNDSLSSRFMKKYGVVFR